jgi:hypothetical protein
MFSYCKGMSGCEELTVAGQNGAAAQEPCTDLRTSSRLLLAFHARNPTRKHTYKPLHQHVYMKVSKQRVERPNPRTAAPCRNP